MSAYRWISDVETFMAGRNAKSLVACRDRACCQKLEDIFNQSQAHALIQSVRSTERLNAQPEVKRIDYLLGEVIPQTGRNLRKARKIKIGDEKLTMWLERKSDRLDLMQQTLERINGDLEEIPIARIPIMKTKPMKKTG